jgi:hypothetical protein
MRILLALAALWGALLGASPACAWSADGHQMVGAVADDLLNPRARAQVRTILGYDLKTAAVWADCVRAVKPADGGGFAYPPGAGRPECRPFEGTAERRRMEDYVKRNWSNCVYAPDRGCHEAFHFADVPVQRDRYDRSYAGTSDHDIVSTLLAAQAVLKGRPAPAPFSIKDRKEAILLIAHMVGDLHQPLHVGAVYLAADGRLVDPGGAGHEDHATETRGGNSLADGGSNLHSEWDREDLGTAPDTVMLHDARAVPKTAGPATSWPAAWATETLGASHLAYGGLRFGAKSHGRWPALNAGAPSYTATRDALQRAQLIRGGAHLAEMLNAVWP